MAILKDREYFKFYDADKFMKKASKNFIFSTEHLNKLFDDYKADMLHNQTKTVKH